MDLLTYIFKGSYVNRKKDKYFIKNILSTFNRDEITGVGIKVNNNPWSFEVFIFITIDTNYLKREKLTEWLKQFDDKYSLHNIFLGGVSKGGNIATFINEDTLIFFDRLFIFSESESELFTRNKLLPTLLFGERSAIVTSNFIEKSKWTKRELSICKELSKNILLLIFDENEERVEKLKKDYSLNNLSIVLMNCIKGDYEPIRKKLLENHFI